MMCTSGTVTDAGGRVINDVKITITNIATCVTRKVTTNDEGFYSAPNLLPGTYELKLSALGFRTEARGGIEVAVGASVALDQALRVGSNLETVVVQSEIPAVPFSTSDISAVVNATTVRELPLNGRSWTDLAQLQPVTSPDSSLYKNNYIKRISGTFNIQFRAEIFNILNHPNFAPPVTPDNVDIFDGTGSPTGVAGLLTKTSTTAREIQFAVKVIF